MQVKRMT